MHPVGASEDLVGSGEIEDLKPGMDHEHDPARVGAPAW